MFVDASVIVAIISREADWQALTAKIADAKQLLVSPLCIWEAVIALGRVGQERSFDEAERLVRDFLAASKAEIIPITAETGMLAVEASRRYGRGRHKADLNFGDCFAYACAQHHRVPLLFKGEDFVHTDIEAA